MGKGISGKLRCSSLYISDPTFTMDINSRLAWYAGNKYTSCQNDIRRLIKTICEKIHVEKLMFFGGSGGGFASLYFSFYFENSLALIWNPQTVIENYRSDVSGEYSNIAFGVDVDDLKKLICSDLRSLYRNGSHNNIICYMQNESDYHMKDHLSPFLREFGVSLPKSKCSNWVSENLYLHVTNWSLNHRPPPRAILAYLLNYFSNPDVVWSKAKFKRVLPKAEKLSLL